jgi:hypothetical protein
MSNQDFKLPRDLAYDADYEEDYNALTGRGKDNPITARTFEIIKDSPFLGKANRDIFLYSMALGFFHKRRLKLKQPKNNIRSDALHQDGEWLVYSVAITEKMDLNALSDMKQVATIAEEYANGGFPILMELIKAGTLGDPEKRMTSDIRKVLVSLNDDEKVRTEIQEGGKSEEAVEETDKDDCMMTIEKLENKLRILVEERLSKISTNWLEERIPQKEMLIKWKETKHRCKRGNDLFKDGDVEPLINYSELGDIYSIIKWSKNWRECFEPIFKDLKVFESDMEQILMIRPEKAHSRPLNNVQIIKLKAIALHFLTLIQNAD